MRTATTIPVHIRIDKKTREEANELFKELGTDMSGAVNMFLKQCINTGSIPFRVRKPCPSKELLEAMEEAEALAKDPNAEVYHTFEEYQAAMQKALDEDE